MSDTKKLSLLPSIADSKFWIVIPLKNLNETQRTDLYSTLSPRHMSWENKHELYIEFRTMALGQAFIDKVEEIINRSD